MTSQDAAPEISTVGQLLDVAERGRWLDCDGRSLVRVNSRDIDAFHTLLTRLGSRFGARFRDRGPYRQMVCTVAEHHGKSLTDVRKLRFGAFLALLEQVPEYRSKKPTAKTEQGEGDGGDDSATPRQPATTSGDAREAVLQQLEPADQKAYCTYAYAETNLGTTTDRQAYQYLSDNGLPDEKDSPELARVLANYTLPTFATWSKQLRNARRTLGEQKHTRRAGRSTGGASIVPASDLDSHPDVD